MHMELLVPKNLHACSGATELTAGDYVIVNVTAIMIISTNGKYDPRFSGFFRIGGEQDD